MDIGCRCDIPSRKLFRRGKSGRSNRNRPSLDNGDGLPPRRASSFRILDESKIDQDWHAILQTPHDVLRLEIPVDEPSGMQNANALAEPENERSHVTIPLRQFKRIKTLLDDVWKSAPLRITVEAWKSSS